MTMKPQRERKTRDEYEIQMHTSEGWECVNTETTSRDARRSIKEYRENQPGSYKIVKKRVKKVFTMIPLKA
jgi:DNA-binding sugar fermentation-stimulating protein